MMFYIFDYLLKVIFDYKLTKWLGLSSKFTSIFQKFIKINVFLIIIV